MASRIDQVCDALILAVTRLLNEASIPGTTLNVKTAGGVEKQIIVAPRGEVYQGFPMGPELAQTLKAGSKSGNWEITVYPKKARNVTRFSPDDGPLWVPPVESLIATIDKSAGTITFSGSVLSANVHTVLDSRGDAFVQTAPGQTFAEVANAVAAAITALDLAGVSASASGAVVTVSGTNIDALKCNVVGIGVVLRETGRICRPLQVSIWASDPYTLKAIEEPILETFGSADQTFLTLPDTTQIYVDYSDDGWEDTSQGTYGLYVGHHIVEVEYGVMKAYPSAQLGAVKNLLTVGNAPQATDYVG